MKKPAASFTTISEEKIKELYAPKDIKDFDYKAELGSPGKYPFTRGIHRDMYRGQLWTMRQFAGMGTACQTNKRYHFLLNKGQTGLSVAFDFPTLYGRDSDDPFSEGEVGKCGVAIDSLQDMEILFKGIPLDKVSTSMTINGPAAILYAFYLAVAEKQNIPFHKLRGTIQNDILKEYIAQKTWIFPPEPSIRLITDIFAFSKDHTPKWNTISVSGYHIREAGSTAAQELAFTLANGFTYIEAGIKVGLKVEDFVSRISFFFNAHLDLFEEIAKFRAARRIWARHLKEKYKVKDEKALLLRFHTQTAGCSLTPQQPEVNIIRTTLEALAGVLGGTQSLHTNSMDEALALPSEKAVEIALRTQQVIAYESGAINTVDPLGGSYFIENLTNKLEEKAELYLKKINRLGGVIKCIENGFLQRQIADSAYRYQKAIEKGEKTIVGVNKFLNPEEGLTIPILEISENVEKEQIARLKKLKKTRDNSKVKKSLRELKKTASAKENIMPKILNCARAYAALGEITFVLKEVFGEYTEPPVF